MAEVVVILVKAVVWNGVVINMLLEALGIIVAIEKFDGVMIGVGVDMLADVDIIVVGVIVVVALEFGVSVSDKGDMLSDVLADGNVNVWAAVTTALEFAMPTPLNEPNR